MLNTMVTFILPSEVTGSEKSKMAAKNLRFLTFDFMSFSAILKVFHQNGLNSTYTIANFLLFQMHYVPIVNFIIK